MTEISDFASEDMSRDIPDLDIEQFFWDTDQLLSAIIEHSHVESVGIDIYIDGERRSYQRSKSGKSIEFYRQGCISDFALAMLTLHAHHHRGLLLDECIEVYLPELALQGAFCNTISIRHLLTRSSGLAGPSVRPDASPADWEKVVGRLTTSPSLYSPGLTYNYAGSDLQILSEILKRQTGGALRELYLEAISEPVGLSAANAPDGYFRTADLLEVALGLMHGGELERGYAPSLRRNLSTEVMPLFRALRSSDAWQPALGLTLGAFTYRGALVGCNGQAGGHACGVRYDPQGGLAFALGVAGSATARDAIIRDLLRRLGRDVPLQPPLPKTIGSLNGLTPAQVTGHYLGWAEGHAAQVEWAGEELICRMTYLNQEQRTLAVRLEDGLWLKADQPPPMHWLEFIRDDALGSVCMTTGFLPYAKY